MHFNYNCTTSSLPGGHLTECMHAPFPANLRGGYIWSSRHLPLAKTMLFSVRPAGFKNLLSNYQPPPLPLQYFFFIFRASCLIRVCSASRAPCIGLAVRFLYLAGRDHGAGVSLTSRLTALHGHWVCWCVDAWYQRGAPVFFLILPLNLGD